MITTDDKENELFFNSPLAAIMIALILLITLSCVLFVSLGEKPSVYRWEPYTVQAGDTLWSISRDSAVLISGEDLSSMSHIIAEKNGITASKIYAGQTILIPAGKE